MNLHHIHLADTFVTISAFKHDDITQYVQELRMYTNIYLTGKDSFKFSILDLFIY